MRIAIGIGLGLVALSCTWAADKLTPMDVKPGLWEATVERPGAPSVPANLPAIPPAALARMSPQQRAQIEAIVKGRGATSAMTTRFCMSADHLKQGGPVAPVDASCTYKVVGSSAAKQQIRLECKHGAETRSGEVTVDRVDSEHITANTVAKSSASDKPITMKTSLKWLSADCGAVKPPAGK
jgi:hypothetical protein